MRKLALAVGLVALISGAAVARDGRVGLMEDCSTTAGWFEWDRNQKEVAPRTKLESRNGLLLVHLNRGLLRAAKKHAWCPEGVDRGSILRKNYGEVDLDKYHYLVVKVKEKGSGVFFGVNGYDTKCGFTTGVTAVDLKDYDDERIHGKRTVRLEMDVHDNLTTLVVDEIKLVSELTPEEKKGFIDRGLTIRHEKLKAKMFHGLDAVMARRTAKLPSLEGEEMVVFRDTATGAVTTRLTAHDRNDYFGEGGLWSGDGAAIRFNSNGRLGRGKPVLRVTVENRGTALLINSSVTVTSGSGTTPLNVTTLPPGEIRSFRLRLPSSALDPDVPLQVESSISLSGNQIDVAPNDNSRTDIFTTDAEP